LIKQFDKPQHEISANDFIIIRECKPKMNNISKEIRQLLAEKYTLSRPTIAKKLVSVDGTIKWLLELQDGEKIECVYIPAEDRGTLCVSSQVGCGMGCRFCNTGSQGLTRSLTCEEIIQQLLVARDELNEWNNLNKKIGEGREISNIVFMGMGEPLANYDNVLKTLQILNDPDGIAFSNRRITLSTCGLAPQIRRLAKDVKLNLALSLHAPNDDIRRQIMPIATKFSIGEVLEACYEFSKATSDRRITFEYTLIKGINDDLRYAYDLIKLVKKYRVPAKFNLLSFNQWDGCPFGSPEPLRVRDFAAILTDARYPAPIRESRGQDIMAACGQLKSKMEQSKAAKI
jgi:23S rRNA (adenine2503-C2)-methyltransferase